MIKIIKLGDNFKRTIIKSTEKKNKLKIQKKNPTSRDRNDNF